MNRIPVPTLHLFPVLDAMLVQLLKSLTPEDWHKPTVARLWNVKDIAAHLLDGNVRAIAALNGYQSNDAPPQINSYQDLVDYLNQLNAVWVKAMKRISPQVLTQQLEITGKQYVEYLNTLDPFAPAMYPVAWAGEDTSLNWFNIAREYTEKWHHQQQIRDAVGVPGLITKELFYPCIDTFMYALPHAYRDVAAPADTLIRITISTEAGGEWFLLRFSDKWQLSKSPSKENPDTAIIIKPDVAWRFFTKAIKSQDALKKSIITGDAQLALQLFNTIAVMA